MLPLENQLILFLFNITMHLKTIIWIFKKIQLIKAAAIISKNGVENISISFMEYIQTTDNLNVDVLFDFLPVYVDQPHKPPFPIGLVEIESESLYQLRLVKQDECW